MLSTRGADELVTWVRNFLIYEDRVSTVAKQSRVNFIARTTKLALDILQNT